MHAFTNQLRAYHSFRNVLASCLGLALALSLAGSPSATAHSGADSEGGMLQLDWRAFPDNSMNLDPIAVTLWDPDGDGPEHARLVVAIRTSSGSMSVWQWDGAIWSQLGGSFSPTPPFGTEINTMTEWVPPNGDGTSTRLVVAGQFSQVGGVVVNNIAQWDGTQWSPLGTGITPGGRAHALAVWSHGGNSQLIAAGGFDTAGGTQSANIARWDGASWHALGSGLTAPNTGVSGRGLALTVWDPDGDGPTSPQLIAGGQFTHAGGNLVRGIARWTGLQWLPLGGGFDAGVEDLTTWDPDGEGPEPNYLVAAGQFSRAGSQLVNHIATWDGAAWSGLDGGFSGFKVGGIGITGLATFDPDGAGPMPRSLVVSGSFDGAGDLVVRYIAQWDGTKWSGMGRGLDAGAMLLEWPAESNQIATHSQLVAASGAATANTAGCAFSPRLALWGLQTRCPRDSNRDGVVTFADLNDVLGSFGFVSPAQGYICADLNNDGIVNFADLNEVLGRFGQSCD